MTEPDKDQSWTPGDFDLGVPDDEPFVPPPPRRCTRCGRKRAVAILYGEPDHRMSAAERAGLIVIGGCVIFEGRPRWECLHCGWQMRKAPKN